MLRRFLIALLVYLVVALLLDLSYEIETFGLPFWAWQRQVRSGVKLTALILFAEFCWVRLSKP